MSTGAQSSSAASRDTGNRLGVPGDRGDVGDGDDDPPEERPFTRPADG